MREREEKRERKGKREKSKGSLRETQEQFKYAFFHLFCTLVALQHCIASCYGISFTCFVTYICVCFVDATGLIEICHPRHGKRYKVATHVSMFNSSLNLLFFFHLSVLVDATGMIDIAISVNAKDTGYSHDSFVFFVLLIGTIIASLAHCIVKLR